MHEGVRNEELAQRPAGERLDPRESQATVLLAVNRVDPAENDEEERAVDDDKRDVRVGGAFSL